jgi:hypothetical protein
MSEDGEQDHSLFPLQSALIIMEETSSLLDLAYSIQGNLARHLYH